MAAIVARKRLDRGVKLNYPEAVSIISDYVVEGARDGKSVAELMESAAHVLKKDDCMDGVAEMIAEVQTDCLLYTSPSPRDLRRSRMPSSA